MTCYSYKEYRLMMSISANSTETEVQNTPTVVTDALFEPVIFSDGRGKATLSDLFIFGLNGGYRRAKWCQEQGNKDEGQEEKRGES